MNAQPIMGPAARPIHFPKAPIAWCARCTEEHALPAAHSAFKLCQHCCDTVFPGADSEDYKALTVLYAY
jgi:hypothetical protein